MLDMSFEALQNEQVSGDGSTCRKINNLLNSSKTRVEGLQLLNVILPQCSDEVFLQFCVSWMQSCCKIDGFSICQKNFAVQLLNDLFKISSNYQELKKSVSFFITTRYFDFFFKYFLHSQAGWACTETCLLLYRGACSPFQENLEKYLKIELQKNARISSKVAVCYALLPSVGGGGNEGICYKKSWKTWFAKLLSITHSLLNDLFADVEESQDYQMPEHEYNKSEIEITPAYLAIQIYNHCSILCNMLLVEYPAPKSIPTDLIFQLLCRGLAVTPKALEKRLTSDIISLTKVLPDVHCSFLSLLKAVIVSCKNQLLPYSYLVCKLIDQTLEWTESEFTCGKEKPFGRLRELAYEALCNWLAATGNGSCAEVISNAVISNAVSDVTLKKKVVFLKEAKHKNQNKNRKQEARRMGAAANVRLCHAALKALQFLLKFAGVSLKPEEHKFLQEFAVKLIMQVQKSSGNKIVPFDAAFCRLELYALLVELTLQPSPKWPPPTHFALSLFKRGLNDDCPQICSLCSTALSMMTIIIHPQYNNGGFPLCETPESKSQREVELQWKKSSAEADAEHPCAVEKNVMDSSGVEIREAELEGEVLESVEVSSKEKVSDLVDESGASSSGDSKTTVAFSKNASNDSLNEVEETNKKSSSEEMRPSEDEPSPKQQKIATEDSSAGDQQSEELVQRDCPDDSPSECKQLKDQLDEPDLLGPLSSVKSLSPESASEEGQVKKRYFLRSKTKGSSEEPEEAIKRAVSLDSLRSTPVRNSPRSSPNILSAAKRPRTRALSKVETNGDTYSSSLKRTLDDDEDILATFDDSFVD